MTKGFAEVTRRVFLAAAAGLAVPGRGLAALPGQRLVAIAPTGDGGTPDALLERLARADRRAPGPPVLHVSRRSLGPLGAGIASLDPAALRLLPAARLAPLLGRPGRIAPAGAAALAAGLDWIALGRLLAEPWASPLAFVVPTEADGRVGAAEIAALRAGLGAAEGATRILLLPPPDAGRPW